MKKRPSIITHTWYVRGTIPTDHQQYPHQGENVECGVQADSMEEAIGAARSIWPDVKIWSCHHRGEINLIAMKKLE